MFDHYGKILSHSFLYTLAVLILVGLDLARLADLPAPVVTEARRVAELLTEQEERDMEQSRTSKLAVRRKALLRVISRRFPLTRSSLKFFGHSERLSSRRHLGPGTGTLVLPWLDSALAAPHTTWTGSRPLDSPGRGACGVPRAVPEGHHGGPTANYVTISCGPGSTSLHCIGAVHYYLCFSSAVQDPRILLLIHIEITRACRTYGCIQESYMSTKLTPATTYDHLTAGREPL